MSLEEAINDFKDKIREEQKDVPLNKIKNFFCPVLKEDFEKKLTQKVWKKSHMKNYIQCVLGLETDTKSPPGFVRKSQFERNYFVDQLDEIKETLSKQQQEISELKELVKKLSTK